MDSNAQSLAAFPTVLAVRDACRAGLPRVISNPFWKEHVSWTRFREKRLTVRGFLTFDRNARLRTYVYMAVALLWFAGYLQISSLVRIACEAIETASLPRLSSVTAGYQTQLQSKALQRELLSLYDTDKNGKINAGEAVRLRSETGLATDGLTCSVLKADFGALLAAAHDRHALPRQITTAVPGAYALSNRDLNRAVRRLGFQAGQAEYKRAHDEMWNEVNPYMAVQLASPSDYMKWETWERGGHRFYGSLKNIELFCTGRGGDVSLDW